MSSKFVKRIVFTVIWAVILAVSLAMMLIGSLISPPGDMSVVEIIGLILGLISGIGLMVNINLWLDFLSYRFGFVYWPLVLVIALVAFGLSFLFTPIPANPDLGTDFNSNHCEYLAMMHGVIIFLALPMLEGHMSHYMVIEETYIEDYHVDTQEYYADFYVPGWWKKLIALGVFGGGFYGLSMITGVYPWLPIVYAAIETLFLGYLTIVAIVRRARAN